MLRRHGTRESGRLATQEGVAWSEGLPECSILDAQGQQQHAGGASCSPLPMNFLLSTLRDWKVTLLPMAAGGAAGHARRKDWKAPDAEER